MKKFPRWLVCLLLLVISADWAAAGRTVHVQGYTRKDGTYISPYDRSAPSSHSYSRSPSSYDASDYAPAPAAPERPFSVAPTGPVRFVPTYDPSREPNWVPAKIRDGQYIPGHLKGDPYLSRFDGPPRNIPWKPDPPARRSTRYASSGAYTRSLSGGSRYSVAPYREKQLTAREWRAIYLESIPTPRSPSPSGVGTAPGSGQSERDANGRIKRSEAAKHSFMRMTGYPNGRPGYVVDHIIPLKRGGADDPSNMQWQTVEEAKAKDKWE